MGWGGAGKVGAEVRGPKAPPSAVGQGETACRRVRRPQSQRAEAREEPGGEERSGSLTSYSFRCSRAL